MATDATRASMQCVVAEAELNQGEYSTQACGDTFQPPVSQWLKSGLRPSGRGKEIMTDCMAPPHR